MASEEKKLVIDVYNTNGEVVAKRELDPRVFGVVVKPELVHFALVAQEANARVVLAKTLGKGEVRGGGKKPWKQKGTGRARHGSIRSPIWRGGGVVFGPRSDRNFSMKINKKVKQKALCMALSQRVQEGKVILIDAVNMPQAKTKHAVAFLKKLPTLEFIKGKKFGFITPPHVPELSRSLRNLPSVRLIGAHSLNVKALVASASLVIPIASVEAIEKQFAKK